MPMAASDIERLIKAAIPDAEVTIRDLAGDGDHYAARVVSRSFAGLSRIKQHQAVYSALGGRVGGELHALQLETAVPQTENNVSDARTRIADIVKKNDVVLFMKGTALFPQCGFSSRAVAILDRLGANYETVDVLQDPEIRAGIKDYSDWPTVPQLYVKGEFVGGSDIMMEMFESGELQQMLGAEA